MSIEYRISENGLRIEAFPSGVLDIKETINYFVQIENDQRIEPGAVEIVYFKHVTDFKLSYLESEKVTQKYQIPKAGRMIKATVFVCESDLAYGIGRMLETFHEITNPEHKVLVVRSEDELERVLLEV